MTRRYRWGETNAGMNWKERGRGDMKLQRNGNSRLLMRRPETKKICCNQVIVPDIKIEYYKGQDNFLQWTSLDFSGDEGSDPTRPCVTPSCQRPLRFFALSYLGIVGKHVTSRQRSAQEFIYSCWTAHSSTHVLCVATMAGMCSYSR